MDQNKTNKYKISINELLFGNSYSPTIDSLKTLLDNNGYFGRYRIELVRDKKFETDTLVKIHVYLIDSGITYTWPYNTFFDLDTKRFGHNRKVPRGVFTDKFMFGYCLNVISIMFTPTEMLSPPLSYFEASAIRCRELIKEYNSDLEDWPWIISKNHGTFGQMPYYERIIPFLCRIGIIVNSKCILLGRDDPGEFSSNLFDIDYWHNL
jgi:hypothetical protein